MLTVNIILKISVNIYLYFYIHHPSRFAALVIHPSIHGIRADDLSNTIRYDTTQYNSDAGAVPYQLSYQANWELVILRVRKISVEEIEVNMKCHIFELRIKELIIDYI